MGNHSASPRCNRVRSIGDGSPLARDLDQCREFVSILIQRKDGNPDLCSHMHCRSRTLAFVQTTLYFDPSPGNAAGGSPDPRELVTVPTLHSEQWAASHRS